MLSGVLHGAGIGATSVFSNRFLSKVRKGKVVTSWPELSRRGWQTQ